MSERRERRKTYMREYMKRYRSKDMGERHYSEQFTPNEEEKDEDKSEDKSEDKEGLPVDWISARQYDKETLEFEKALMEDRAEREKIKDNSSWMESRWREDPNAYLIGDNGQLFRLDLFDKDYENGGKIIKRKR